MKLAAQRHTVGDRKRWIVEYCNWLKPGISLVTGAAVSDSLTCTVSDVSITADKLIFFLNDGELSETLTVTVSITDTRTQEKNDTITFEVVAP